MLQQQKIKLEDLGNLLLTHTAFTNEKNTRLEQYNIKIIWLPKYHFELNRMEGVWCDSKRYVRIKNDQDFSKFGDLIIEALEEYEKKRFKY